MEKNINIQLGILIASGEEMGRRARARVVESFGWKDHVRAWECLYLAERREG